MNVSDLLSCLEAKFYTGVPDSQLKALCNHLMDEVGISSEHIIAANEGNAVALAAGYHLATKKIPVVYLQNSGIGNIINPVISLLDRQVYAIPCIFIVGWRGEPGVYDEPQHLRQGQITKKLLEDIGLNTFVVDVETTKDDIKNYVNKAKVKLEQGESIAFLVKKGGLYSEASPRYENEETIPREEIIRYIVDVSEEDIIVSTTGKTSRELFEIREKNKCSHKYDFLTVGSMGHSSSIALGVAMNKPQKKVWCIDGDGACLMHMGALAVIGAKKPKNLVHIVVNNMAHESVGGMPTVANSIDFAKIAEGCGYEKVYTVKSLDDFKQILVKAKETEQLCFITIKAAIGSRKDLGRPSIAPQENKKALMDYLSEQ